MEVTDDMKFGLLIVGLLFFNLLGAMLVKFIGSGDWELLALGFLLIVLFVTYSIRVFIWMYLGRTMQLSFVYPFIGLNYILSFLIGLTIYGESFSIMRLAGSLFILAGVVVLSRSTSKKDEVINA